MLIYKEWRASKKYESSKCFFKYKSLIYYLGFEHGFVSTLNDVMMTLFQLRLLAPVTHQSSHTSRHSQSSLITKTERHQMTNRDFYARYVLAQFQAFYILPGRKVFFHSASLFFLLHTPDFVVSLWCGDMKMYSSCLRSNITLSQWERSAACYQLYYVDVWSWVAAQTNVGTSA